MFSHFRLVKTLTSMFDGWFVRSVTLATEEVTVGDTAIAVATMTEGECFAHSFQF